MISRRQFLAGAATLSVAPHIVYSAGRDVSGYDDLVSEIYRHSRQPPVKRLQVLHELVRYGTMAANSHNSQPWKFTITEHQIRILPDFDRRCPAVDPDDHHLYASLGCAAENILIAANAFGLYGEMEFSVLGAPQLIITFDRKRTKTTPSFDAIPSRQCTRAVFNGATVPSDRLGKITAISASPDVGIDILTSDQSKKVMTEYVVEGNNAQMDDREFVNELRDWIRFNEADAIQFRDGLTYRSTGNPSVPDWVGEILFEVMYRKRPENDKYRDQIASSAGIAVFSCAEQTRSNWVNVGRAYQRFALQSTTQGIRHAFINQPVEVPTVRPQLASYLQLGDRLPDLIIRFGYGDLTPRTLRRPVNQVVL